jgi:hypothetical protein
MKHWYGEYLKLNVFLGMHGGRETILYIKVELIVKKVRSRSLRI